MVEKAVKNELETRDKGRIQDLFLGGVGCLQNWGVRIFFNASKFVEINFCYVLRVGKTFRGRGPAP